MTVMALTNYYPDCSSDINFRAWGSAISNGIAGLGWIKTADIGQVNWTTVTKPTVANTFTGYEIWRANDSLQGTDPIYFKISYGIGWINTQVNFQITVGTASDGSGNITSAPNTNTSVLAMPQLHGTANNVVYTLSPGVTGTAYIVGDSSTFWFFQPAIIGYQSMTGFFGIERSRNFDGTPGAGGFIVHQQSWWYNSTTYGSTYCYIVLTHNAYPQNFTNLTHPISMVGSKQSGTALLNGGASYAIPLWTGAVPRFGAPSKYVVAVLSRDNPPGVTFSLNHYGVQKTFLVTGSGLAYIPTNNGTLPTDGLLYAVAIT